MNHLTILSDKIDEIGVFALFFIIALVTTEYGVQLFELCYEAIQHNLLEYENWINYRVHIANNI